VAVLAALVTVMVLALPATADNVVNDVTATSPIAFEWQGSDSVVYTLRAVDADGQTGCNATDGTPMTLTLDISQATPAAGWTNTVLAAGSTTTTSVTFNGCGAARTRSIAFSASAPAQISVPASAYTTSDANATGGSYTGPANHTVFAYDLQSYTVNPAASPLNCTGTVTDAWGAGDTVCVRVAPIPNTMTNGDIGTLEFDFVRPDGSVQTVTGSTGANRSVASVTPAACGTWTTRLYQRPTSGARSLLDTDTFVVSGCDQGPELTVPQDITVDTNDPSGAVVAFQASATDVADEKLGIPLAPTCAPGSGSLFPVGTTQVTCSVTDSHGNTATDSFDVTVNLYEAWFEAPIDKPSVVNVAKVGRVIPVKAWVAVNGVADTSGPISLEVAPGTGCAAGEADGVEAFASLSAASDDGAFRWADGRWVNNFDTSGMSPGCYRANVYTGSHLAGWFLIRLAR
jgi:hypothetical protein